MEDVAKLLIPGSADTIELPVFYPTIGNPAIDIQPINSVNLLSYDPGFMVTGSCESKISYIDGENGILLHRGYPIKQLAMQAEFLEVAYLLLEGELPNHTDYQKFVHDIKYHTMVHEQVRQFFNGFRRDAHPMAVMLGVVGALSSFYHDALDIHQPQHRKVSAFRLIAKMPTLAAMCYKYSIGQPFVYPDNSLSYSANLLHMLFSTPTEQYKVSPSAEKAINRILILHADHEQNASTATVRLAGSTGANPFACISAGIAALWGPAHGGANEACLNMLRTIGDVKNINMFIKKAKDKNDPFRLMGFGHRIYKNYDPRAKIIKESCHEVLQECNSQDLDIFKVALALEKIAMEDDYFVSRKLYPNVDFYSGLTLSALGIPTNLFTVMFAVSRTVGWVSHWHEMISSKDKLSRPRQLYTGSARRDFIGIEER